MDSLPSAQNDNTLCGNAYRPFDCTSERQRLTDYGLPYPFTSRRERRILLTMSHSYPDGLLPFDFGTPLSTSHYSSMADDMQRSIDMFEYRNKLRQVALRPLKLHAGQRNKPNGEFGRYFAWDPIMVPEMTGGRILTTTV
ncbi:MAG: hypothetical protein LBQ51_01590 [Desulfovibrio sp.]|jgi:hypothetical protein|nr:hypothetical protein [Desulfovibrio sp.]